MKISWKGGLLKKTGQSPYPIASKSELADMSIEAQEDSIHQVPENVVGNVGVTVLVLLLTRYPFLHQNPSPQLLYWVRRPNTMNLAIPLGISPHGISTVP